MDWSKAKNILIAALLITNLMLGMAIYHNTNGSSSDAKETKQNVMLLLQDHNIFVDEEEIPDRTERLPVMSVRYRSVRQEDVQKLIQETEVQLSPQASKEDYRYEAEKILQTAGIVSEHLIFEGVFPREEETTVQFGVEYEEYSVDNAKVQVVFSGGKLADLPTSWVEPVSMGQNRKKVLPAYEALIRFMTLLEERGYDEIHVEQMRLVYWLEGYTEHGGVSEDTAVPYWCIRYNNGESEHIAAYEE